MLTLGFAAVEAGVGLWAGSLALVADAGHMVNDAAGPALAGVPGVASVHDLHIWQVKAGEPLLSAHLVVEDIARWEGILGASHALLAERFGIRHATLQPEPMLRTVRWRQPPGHGDDHD